MRTAAENTAAKNAEFLNDILAINQALSNVGISCGCARLPGGPARRVLRRRRDGSGRQLHAELGPALRMSPPERFLPKKEIARGCGEKHIHDNDAPAERI